MIAGDYDAVGSSVAEESSDDDVCVGCVEGFVEDAD